MILAQTEEEIFSKVQQIQSAWKRRKAENVAIKELLHELKVEVKKPKQEQNMGIITLYIEDLQNILFEVNHLEEELNRRDTALRDISTLAQEAKVGEYN